MNALGDRARAARASHAIAPVLADLDAAQQPRRAVSSASGGAPLVEPVGDERGLGAGRGELAPRCGRCAASCSSSGTSRCRCGSPCRGSSAIVRRERQPERASGARRSSPRWRPRTGSIQFTVPVAPVVRMMVDVEHPAAAARARPRAAPRCGPGSGQSVRTMTSNGPRAPCVHTCQRSAPGRKASTSGTGCGPAVASPRQPAALERQPQAEQRAEHVAVRMDVAEHEGRAARPREQVDEQPPAARRENSTRSVLAPRPRPSAGARRGAPGCARRAPSSGRAGSRARASRADRGAGAASSRRSRARSRAP